MSGEMRRIGRNNIHTKMSIGRYEKFKFAHDTDTSESNLH